MAGSGSDEHLARLRENAELRARATAERDRLIIAAHEAGATVVSVASAAGLSRMQVHRIIGPATDSDGQ